MKLGLSCGAGAAGSSSAAHASCSGGSHSSPPVRSCAGLRLGSPPALHQQPAAHRPCPSVASLPQWRCVAARSAPRPGPLSDPAVLAGMFMAYAAAMAPPAPPARPPGAALRVRGLSYHPAGAEAPLLDSIDLDLPANSLGLVFGRSGSGKTTLLQLLAGLAEQTAGEIFLDRGGDGASAGSSSARNGAGGGAAGASQLPPSGSSASAAAGNGVTAAIAAAGGPLSVSDRMREVGLVFQFPERHFLGDDLLSELTFAWPRGGVASAFQQRAEASARLQAAVSALSLTDIPMTASPMALSGGQQRRLALAIQLARGPSLLLLDEPLAGLDWRARREVVGLLKELKKECTLLVVSHDLAEVSPLVDAAYRMKPGGRLQPVAWPPEDMNILNT